MALHLATHHPDKFAGVIALSCYLPLAQEPAKLRNGANLRTPDLHGAWHAGSGGAAGARDDSRQLLSCAGYNVDWHTYPMPHAVCEPEVADLRAWLTRALAVTA